MAGFCHVDSITFQKHQQEIYTLKIHRLQYSQ